MAESGGVGIWDVFVVMVDQLFFESDSLARGEGEIGDEGDGGD